MQAQTCTARRIVLVHRPQVDIILANCIYHYTLPTLTPGQDLVPRCYPADEERARAYMQPQSGVAVRPHALEHSKHRVERYYY